MGNESAKNDAFPMIENTWLACVLRRLAARRLEVLALLSLGRLMSLRPGEDRNGHLVSLSSPFCFGRTDDVDGMEHTSRFRRTVVKRVSGGYACLWEIAGD